MNEKTTPAALGFSMPAEWEQHEATWIGWPHNPTDWPDKLEPIQWVYGEIVRKIAPGEIVRILVNSLAHEKQVRGVLKRAGVDLKRVQFFRFPTNRGWTRDFGPIFVKRAISRLAEGRCDSRPSGATFEICNSAGALRRPRRGAGRWKH